MSQHRLLTISQACEMLAVGRTTLHAMRRSGQIPFVRIGKGGVRISLGAIEEFIRKSEEGRR